MCTGIELGIIAGGQAAGSAAVKAIGGVLGFKAAQAARRQNTLATLQELEVERQQRANLLAENQVLEGASGLGGESQFRLRLRNITSSLEDERRIRLAGVARDKQLKNQGIASLIGAAGGSTDSLLTGAKAIAGAG